MEKILIFFIFLGPLVFFHELGHFLFARLAGVRVEVFSIGFGPKILSFKKGDTKYALSLIPLGGYVKMFGDDPLSEKELTPEEEKVAYTKKGKWARFWIVFGGPLANFILAFFIYLALVGIGERVPEVKLGKIVKDSTFESLGFQTGDIIKKVNHQTITSFDDFNVIDSQINKVTVERENKLVDIKVNFEAMKFLEAYGKSSEPLRAPIVVSPDGNSYILKFENDKWISLEEIFNSNEKFIRLIPFKAKTGIQTKFDPNEFEFEVVGNERSIQRSGTWEGTLRLADLYPRDLLIKNIAMASAAEKVGLKAGSIITEIGGKPVFHFSELKERVQALNDEKPISLTIKTKEGKKQLSVTPTWRDYDGQRYLSIGIESGISFYARMVESKVSGVADTFSKATTRTLDGMEKTLLGFKKLITGEVPLKHVGGPIAIGQVASETFNISLSMFFRLMALISINLGIINLFPIPVLDGGHIVFIILEAINRGPLSRKKMMYAQQVGMSLLFVLIFVALYNDISKFFFNS